MADLTVLNKKTTLNIMDEAVEEIISTPRKYLGMSSIGEECNRKLWLQFHLGEHLFKEFGIGSKINAKSQRIFAMGDYVEDKIVEDLKRAGLKVEGQQEGFSDFNGAFKGHSDGTVTGLVESNVPHILEIKSANDKNFKLFVKHGIKGHPIYGEKYYAQAQCYLKYSKLKRALFIVENKNTSERYMERINYSAKDFKGIKEKARIIIESTSPPSGISTRIDFWKCKFCDFNNEDSCRKDWSAKNGW